MGEYDHHNLVTSQPSAQNCPWSKPRGRKWTVSIIRDQKRLVCMMHHSIFDGNENLFFIKWLEQIEPIKAKTNRLWFVVCDLPNCPRHVAYIQQHMHSTTQPLHPTQPTPLLKNEKKKRKRNLCMSPRLQMKEGIEKDLVEWG